MPHLIVEHSSTLDFPAAEALAALTATLCASPEIPDEAALKARVVRQEHFAVGTAPEPRAFVHAQLRLLAGRSPEAKQELAQRIATVLRRLTPRPDGVLVQLSVEIADMERAPYIKERL